MAQQLLPGRFVVLYLALFFGVVFASSVGCGHTATRTDTIHATIVAVDAAHDGFTAWDRETSRQLLDAATSREDAIAKLDAHDKKVDEILALFAATYEAGKLALKQSDDRSLKAAIKAASALFDAIAAVKRSP